MGLSLKPQNLKRYSELARLAFKYGRSDLVSGAGLDEYFPPEERGTEIADPKAEELARDLEQLGPIFIKLGQVLSSRPDLLPETYIQALSRLQDHVDPFPYDDVERIVEEELGLRISQGFAEFEREPMASASLGQVHRATLRDGRRVAVKVQRPGIRQQIADDYEALKQIADFADSHTEAGHIFQFGRTLDEFRKLLSRELDYEQEARNLVQIGHNLQQFNRIFVPEPVKGYTTSRVLTMDFVRGRKVTEISPLRRMELDGTALADQLFAAYLKQTLVDGLFHADPHPGNVFLTHDNNVALVDLGMVGEISPTMQDQLLKILLAVSEGRSDEAADVAIAIGEPLETFDEGAFRRRVAELVSRMRYGSGEDSQIGRGMLLLAKNAGDSGIRMPSELSMLSKTLTHLDEVARLLDPSFDPNEAVRRHGAAITQQRVIQSLSPGAMFAGAMEVKEFAQELPGRVNRILDALARNQLKITVDAIDEKTLVDGFQKVANRITTGLILAALIIGASLLMRVETNFRILGYPGLAMILFLAAAAGGFWLVFEILINDREVRRKS